MKYCLREAVRVIVINKETKFTIPPEYHYKVSIIPGIGVKLCDSSIIFKDSGYKIKILSSGDLRYLKGFHLTVEGFNKFIKRGNDGTLYIIGEGKEKKRLQNLVKKMEIEEKVIFQNKLPQHEFYQRLREIDVFLFPSFEGGGMVVIEAMSYGKPVVCLDYGGPGEMVIPDCGFKVPIERPEEVTAGLTDALEKLSLSPNLRRKMGEAGRKRVEAQFEWQVKGKMIAKLYQEVLSSS